MIADITARVARYQDHMATIEVRKSAQELRAIWAAGNEYLQAEAPWTTFKTDPDKAAAQVRLALNLIPLYATLSAPFIPAAAQSMLRCFLRKLPTKIAKHGQSGLRAFATDFGQHPNVLAGQPHRSAPFFLGLEFLPGVVLRGG